jgi:hypothetical protein
MNNEKIAYDLHELAEKLEDAATEERQAEADRWQEALEDEATAEECRPDANPTIVATLRRVADAIQVDDTTKIAR